MASTDGGGCGRGVGWDEEVEGRPHWRGGARRAEGRRPQGRIKADLSEDIVAVGEATGGGGRGDGGRRRGGRGALYLVLRVDVADSRYFNPKV